MYGTQMKSQDFKALSMSSFVLSSFSARAVRVGGLEPVFITAFSARAVRVGGLEPVFITVRLAPIPFLSTGCLSELYG